MADDLKNRGAQDRSRVNVHEEHEVRYWTQKLGVTKEQLVAAVGKAGVSVDAVARELGKARRAPVGIRVLLLPLQPARTLSGE
jgi:hypothetical protein